MSKSKHGRRTFGERKLCPGSQTLSIKRFLTTHEAMKRDHDVGILIEMIGLEVEAPAPGKTWKGKAKAPWAHACMAFNLHDIQLPSTTPRRSEC